MQQRAALVCVVLLAAVAAAQGPDRAALQPVAHVQQDANTEPNATATDDEQVPFCDEVDTHPSATDSPSTSPDSSADNAGDLSDSVIPNAEQHATAVGNLISEVTGQGVDRAVRSFEGSVSTKLQQASAIDSHMKDTQTEIEELVLRTLPATEAAVASRRDRALQLRQHIKVLNDKLRAIISSLDRSSSIQEQQNLMSIIDGLMRIKNTIELTAEGSAFFGSPSTQQTQPHPTHAMVQLDKPVAEAVTEVKAVVSQHQSSTEDDEHILEVMHALDLLEVEAQTQEQALPYKRRQRLLARRLGSILSQLIDIFNTVRQKHKQYAKNARDMWSKEIDVLQKQLDEMATNLEMVNDQAEFYIDMFNKQSEQLRALVKEQQESQVALQTVRQRLHDSGVAFHKLSEQRAFQTRALHEITHLLGASWQTPFDPAVYAFACDGVPRGRAVVDVCGVCGGGNTSCIDCAGVPYGQSSVDVCGECGGNGASCSYYCDANPNSGKIKDLCGLCGGDSTACRGCDGLPLSGLVLDSCGVCGGDGSSCGAQPQDSSTIGAGEVMIVTTFSAATQFRADWSADNSNIVRDTVAGFLASSDATGSPRVHLVSAMGTVTVDFVVGIIVNEAASDSVNTAVIRGVQGFAPLVSALTDALQSTVKLLDGPTIVRGLEVPLNIPASAEGPSVTLAPPASNSQAQPAPSNSTSQE